MKERINMLKDNIWKLSYKFQVKVWKVLSYLSYNLLYSYNLVI